MNRAQRIQTYLWNLDEKIPNSVLVNLSKDEQKYLIEYDKLLRNYETGVGFSLTSDIAPPRSLYIEVRFLKDCSIEIEGKKKREIQT